MKKLILLSLIALTQVSFAKAKMTETMTYADIYPVIDQIAEKDGVENLLVVFDIDDTLLVIDHCQKENGEWTKGIGKLFACPSVHTDDTLSAKIVELQSKGVATIALTARGKNLVRATQRELKREHDGLDIFDFDGLPFSQDISSIEVPKKRKCRQNEEGPCFKDETTTSPKFEDGVMYAQGAHKGAALKNLLELLEVEFKNIVFVDDRDYNTEAVYDVYKDDENTYVESILYLEHRD